MDRRKAGEDSEYGLPAGRLQEAEFTSWRLGPGDFQQIENPADKPDSVADPGRSSRVRDR
jgi:hypothetical protein